MTPLLITIILLLIVALALFMMRVHQFNQPRTIRWQIGHQVFTFQFPFRWMHLESIDYFKNFLALVGGCVLGLLILMAVLFFLFLFIGILLPIVLIIGLIAVILVLIFVI